MFDAPPLRLSKVLAVLSALVAKIGSCANGRGRSDIGGTILAITIFFFFGSSLHDAIVAMVVGATVGVDLIDAMVGLGNGSKRDGNDEVVALTLGNDVGSQPSKWPWDFIIVGLERVH